MTFSCMKKCNDMFCETCYLFSLMRTSLNCEVYMAMIYSWSLLPSVWHILWLKRGRKMVLSSPYLSAFIMQLYVCYACYACIFCCCIYFATISSTCRCWHVCCNILMLFWEFIFLSISAVHVLCCCYKEIGTCLCVTLIGLLVGGVMEVFPVYVVKNSWVVWSYDSRKISAQIMCLLMLRHLWMCWSLLC
jgi:hypothetical protein